MTNSGKEQPGLPFSQIDQDQDIPQSCRPGFKGAPSDDGPEDDEKDYRSDLGYIRQRNVRNGFWSAVERLSRQVGIGIDSYGRVTFEDWKTTFVANAAVHGRLDVLEIENN